MSRARFWAAPSSWSHWLYGQVRRLASGHSPGADVRTLAAGAARLASVLDVARRAATSPTNEGALAAILASFGERTGAALAELAVWDDERRAVAPAAVWGGRTDRERSPVAEQRFVADVMTRDAPILQRLPSGESYPFRIVPDQPTHVAYLLGVPIHAHGDVVGGLCAAYGEPLPAPSRQLIDEAAAHAVMLGLSLHAAGEVAAWRRIATHDSLTGCLNRVALRDVLEEEIERCERYGRALSCVMIDLVRFKEINDRWGHRAGDEVLIEVGSALLRGVRLYDRVARYGGDEFVIVMPETSLQSASEVVARIAGAVWRATDNLGHPVEINAGIVEWAAGCSPGRLLDVADALMFDAKRRGERLAASVATPGESPIEAGRPAHESDYRAR